MKYLTKSLFSILFLIPLSLISQEIDCKDIYVWDFKTDKNEINDLTKTLTNEVEDILTQIYTCTILQRRKYARIEQHKQNEGQISSLEGMSSQLKSDLKTIKATKVLFGEVATDFNSNVRLRLSLEHLITKKINTYTINIEAKSVINPQRRFYVLKREILAFLKIKASTKNLFDKSFLERMLTDDCTNIRETAGQIGLYLSTNCSYRVVDFEETNGSFKIRVHSRGKIWDEYFNAFYEILDKSNYKLLKITK